MSTLNPVTCNRCGTTNLAWHQTNRGKWTLRDIMRDPLYGEVPGPFHRCEDVFAIRERMAQAEAAKAAAERDRTISDLGTRCLAAWKAGDADEAARLAAEYQALAGAAKEAPDVR